MMAELHKHKDNVWSEAETSRLSLTTTMYGVRFTAEPDKDEDNVWSEAETPWLSLTRTMYGVRPKHHG
ncbi:hypothetical protein ACOMHN_023202 [Nucella lapillus]